MARTKKTARISLQKKIQKRDPDVIASRRASVKELLQKNAKRMEDLGKEQSNLTLLQLKLEAELKDIDTLETLRGDIANWKEEIPPTNIITIEDDDDEDENGLPIVPGVSSKDVKQAAKDMTRIYDPDCPISSDSESEYEPLSDPLPIDDPMTDPEDYEEETEVDPGHFFWDPPRAPKSPPLDFEDDLTPILSKKPLE